MKKIYIYIYLENPGRLVNHSCNPNAGIKDDKLLIAIKNIRKNEQILSDYSTTMDEDYFTMQCECDEPNCRKIVKDFKYLQQKPEENI
ncbi:MAG: SET domain-containing protein-lysine N-methyltransferase [Nanoarchaeota archaeon]